MKAQILLALICVSCLFVSADASVIFSNDFQQVSANYSIDSIMYSSSDSDSQDASGGLDASLAAGVEDWPYALAYASLTTSYMPDSIFFEGEVALEAYALDLAADSVSVHAEVYYQSYVSVDVATWININGYIATPSNEYGAATVLDHFVILSDNFQAENLDCMNEHLDYDETMLLKPGEYWFYGKVSYDLEDLRSDEDDYVLHAAYGFELKVVPEPVTLLLLALMAPVALRRRRSA